MIKFTKISVILCVLIAALIFQESVFAQSDIGTGTDLIILIDQSNSMFGVTSAGTDPDGRRVSTAQYLIDYMTFDNMYVNPNRVNRVLVIAFGSYGREQIIVPLTTLTSEENADTAKALVEPLRKPQQSLNGTDFISVLERVAQQFPPVSEDPDITSGLRQRIIVIITDGGPDIRGTGYDDDNAYFTSLGQIYDAKLGQANYPVYVIGIDKNDPPIYWTQVEDLWVNNVTGDGHAVRVTETGEINKQIIKFLCPALNPSGKGECQLQEIGDHFILPYARSVSFSFFKYDPDAQIELYRPTDSGETGGKIVRAGDSDVLEYKPTRSDEFFGLSFPQPGCWKSERIGAGKVDVLAQIVFNDMVMTKPSSAHPLVSALNFEFSLKDSEGNPIDEQINFPVHLEAQLAGPTGIQSVPMSKIQPGFYASTQGALTSSEGLYTLSLTGDTTIPALKNCLDSQQTFSIFSQTFQIPVYMPTIVLSAPSSSYYHYKPLTGLAVQFVDRNGFPLAEPIDSRYQVEMTLESPLGEKRQLSDVQSDGNGFRSNEPLFLPEPGNYNLTLILRDPNNHNIAFEDTVSFEVTNAVNLLHPGPQHPAFAPAEELEIELYDETGTPLAYDSDHPLDVSAKLSWPDGSSAEVLLNATEEGGHYKASINWELTQAAPYTVEIVGSTSVLPGMPIEPVFIARKTFNVSDNLPFFAVIEPTSPQSVPIYPLHTWYFPPLTWDFSFSLQPIAVELRHTDRKAQAQEFFVDDINTLVLLTLVGPDNATIVERLPLPSTDGTTFSVDLPGLKQEGMYTATISLAGQIRGGIPTEGAWSDITVTFQRYDPLIYKIAWAILTSIMVVLIVYFGVSFLLNHFFLPKAKGTLTAETTGTNPDYLQEFAVTPRQVHHFKIKGREIDSRLGLSHIEIRWAQPQQTSRGEVKAQHIRVKAYNKDGVLVADQDVKAGGRVRVTTQRTVPTGEGEQPKAYHLRYEE